MEEWKEYKLGDICTKIGSGATPKGGKEAYLGGDTSLIRSQNVLDFSFSWDGLVYIDDEQAAKLNGVEIAPGDVLLNITGDSVARACIVPESALPARVNQHVSIIRGDTSLVLNDYILCFLQYKKTYLLSLSKGGATRNALTKGMIEDLKIPLPPISKQTKIVSILKSLDDKIEVNRKINENLEQQAQALFKSWFVDFEPFKNGEFVESELGMIPKGWRVGTLGEIMNITSGKRPAKKESTFSHECNIPLVGASDIMGYTNSVLFSEDILVIGRVGTHGIVQRFNYPCWPSDNTLVIKSDYYEYCYQVLCSIDYTSLNRGSTQPLITQTDIKNQLIIIPPQGVINEYEKCTSTLMKAVDMVNYLPIFFWEEQMKNVLFIMVEFILKI